ncbi:MAG: metalloprotease yebA precursor [uncultured bacterium]|nr:MAG: metalloprotease yebA precursor [uncultured bacterium]
MRKIRIELPKYRLQLDVKLVKRRKPLLALSEEPIIPKPSVVRKKYRKGTFAGRLARYLADHRNIGKVFAVSFVAISTSAAFIPQTTNVQAQGAENVVIESQTNLMTEKSMIYPVAKIKINQDYYIFHKGLDLGGGLGTSIRPIMSGVVAYAGWDRSGYGNLVILEHKSGIDSYYAHLSKINVKTGQSVDTNTEIGKMGATGRASGVHLHLEVHQNGVSLNPLTVLSK